MPSNFATLINGLSELGLRTLEFGRYAADAGTIMLMSESRDKFVTVSSTPDKQKKLYWLATASADLHAQLQKVITHV